MPKALFYRWFFVFILVSAGSGLKAQFYNGSQQEFGQNRVQYNGFSWQSHDYERFKVYFNNGSKELAIFAARAAQKHLLQIEKLLDYKIKEKIEFVVYNTQSAFRQSNVGLNADAEYNIGGVTKLVGSKVFLYYEGTHEKLEQQIRGGIAHVMLNMMMYGTSWKEVFKNQTLVTLPEWYEQGFISYISNPWSPEIETHIKNGILSGKFAKFNHLEGDEAKWAGHAIWNYVAEVKGENHITNVLYMSRISKNVENGFVYTMGHNLPKLSAEYIKYYSRKFELDGRDRQPLTQEEINVKQKRGRTYSNFKISPNGRYLAFTTHERGQWKVWIYDFEKKSYKRIEKGEHKLARIEDRTYPVLCWHPLGEGLTYMVEKKGALLMKIYQVENKRKLVRPIGKLEKVLDFSYSQDGKTLAISGVYLGQTDLYLFKPNTGGFDQITNDVYDDLYPEFVNRSTGVIFSSNRPNDTIAKKPEIKPFITDLDIFIYEIGSRRPVLTRVTQTPYVNETQPAQYDTSAYTYLSDENGIVNRVVSERDSTLSHVDTIMHYRYYLRSQTKSDYAHNILEYDMNWKKGTYTQLLYFDNKWHYYKGRTKDEKNLNLGVLTLTENRYVANRSRQISSNNTLPDSLFNKSDGKIIIIDNQSTKDTAEINISDYIFKDEKPKYEKETIVISDKNNTNKKDSLLRAKSEIPFELPDQELYRINFATDYFATQLNFQSLNAMYQRYNGPGSEYENPGMNGLIKVGMSDVFEDYRLIGGFRYSADLSNNEYLMIFDDLSRRLDKRYMVYRQAYLTSNSQSDLIKIQSYDTRYALKYPFSEVLSLRGTIGYRYDRRTVLALDYNDLFQEPTHEHRGSAKIEFVFDNTLPKGLNLYNGTRAKVFFEYYKDIFKEKTNFFVTGIDFRHYQKIHRCIIWASRLAASASFGDQRLVYYLGGVDNWIARNRFDNTIQVPQDQNYAFQTLATPMRGFMQNVRNGSNFAVINNEIRIPVVRYLMNRPIRSDFLHNFQVVPFFDVGAAWTGLNPYSDKNSFNTTVIATQGNPIVIILENQREPIVYGYGWGLRSRIFGYFVRFDWAWGVNDGVVQPSMKYLSFCLDF